MRYLAVEIYKAVAEINSKFMWTYFLKNSISFVLKNVIKFFYLLQDQEDMELIDFCSEAVFFGIDFPQQSKSETLNKFKLRLKCGEKIHCSCNARR